jgi:hypothetical protein
MAKSKLVEDLYPLFDPATAAILNRNQIVLRWAGQRKSSWTGKQKVCFLDTVVRNWSCAPIYLITREQDGVVTENVFDGAHKLESIYEYMRDEYPITEIDSASWTTSPLREYVGKKFSELPREMQSKIRKYEFSVNYVPDEVANSPEARQLLWQRLNNAGTPLNGYELDIPIYGPLHRLLEDQASEWTQSVLYTRDESQRGKLEEKLYQLLALSDETWQLPSFSSLPDLYVKWRKTLGSTIPQIEARIDANTHDYIARLKTLRKILKELEARGTFQHEEVPIHMTSHQVTLLVILGRLGYWFQDFSKFNIHAEALSARFKAEFFLKTPDELAHQLECPNRNAKFQSKLIEYVDSIFEPLSKRERRYFTKAERKIKLSIQHNRCAICSQKVLLSESEADHIIPFCQGGKTTIENCQVLHRHCHQNKSSSPPPS